MRKYIFLLSLIAVLSGCVYIKNVDDGSGYLGQIYGNVANEDKEDFDAYVIEHGVPTSRYTLQNGDAIYSFIKQCDNQKQEETSVIVNKNNKIENILFIRTCEVK